MAQSNYSDSAAVAVRNATKTYKVAFDILKWKSISGPPVLRNLNLTVPTGKIYAVLGNGGCGKTTLLRCILKRSHLDSGSVELFGLDLRPDSWSINAIRVGYMAQQTRFFQSLTVEETLYYHGRILGLSSAFMAYKIKTLGKFLRLPKKSAVIDKLSDGEMKRLSFAVSVIHEPNLLFLDEPTICMDPLSRQRVWTYLEDLVKRRSTAVIITTQFCEEAKLADIVGCMHQGEIVAEGPLDDLLTDWTCSSLDDLCDQIVEHNAADKNTHYTEATAIDVANTRLTRRRNSNNCRRSQYRTRLELELMLAARRDGYKYCHVKMSDSPRLVRAAAALTINFIRLFRFRLVLFMLFVLPSIFLMSALIGVGNQIKDVRMGFFIEDKGEFGASYVADLDKKLFNLIPVESHDAGYEAVNNGEIDAFLQIGKNFSETVIDRFTRAFVLTQDILRMGFLHLKIDTINRPILYTVGLDLMAKMERLWQKVLIVHGHSPIHCRLPVDVHFRPEALTNKTFTFTIVPLLIVTCIFIAQFGTVQAFLFVKQRRGNFNGMACVFEDIENLEMFIGFAVTLIFIAVVQTALIIFITFVGFQIPLSGSVIPIVCVTIMVGTSGMAYGLFLKSITDNVFLLVIFGKFAPVGISYISGIFFPIESMPYFAQYFIKGLPLFFPGRALADIMYRGFNFFDRPVINGLVVSTCWTLLLTSLAFICLRIRTKLS